MFTSVLGWLLDSGWLPWVGVIAGVVWADPRVVERLFYGIRQLVVDAWEAARLAHFRIWCIYLPTPRQKALAAALKERRAQPELPVADAETTELGLLLADPWASSTVLAAAAAREAAHGPFVVHVVAADTGLEHGPEPEQQPTQDGMLVALVTWEQTQAALQAVYEEINRNLDYYKDAQSITVRTPSAVGEHNRETQVTSITSYDGRTVRQVGD